MKSATLWLAASLLTALLAVSPASLAAEAYPTRPVRIVVPSAAGSALDTFARIVAEELGKQWGTPVLVESKSGGGGQIAATAVAQAKPDGYTLFLPNDQLYLANRFAYRKLAYDPDTSFRPISLLIQADQFIVSRPDTPYKSLAELVEYARKNPDKVAYGQWSRGSSPELVFEGLNRLAGTRLMGVMYRGVGPVMQAMLGKEVQLTVMTASTGSALLSAGQALPLAVASDIRSAQYPDVPTTAELGYPSLKAATWYALAAPAGTPDAIVDKIGADVRKILRDPTFFQRHKGLTGWSLVTSTPAEMTATVKSQTLIMEKLIEMAGIEPE